MGTTQSTIIMANAPAPSNLPTSANGEDPVAAFLRAQLGRCLRIREAIPGHRMRIIVRLGRAFELCDLENREFDWFLYILRAYLACLRVRYLLVYQRLFWVHHPQTHLGELYTVTYKLIAPQSRINQFLTHFPRAMLYAHETSCHLVASSYEVGQRYRDFGHLYVTEQFGGWKVSPAVVASIEHLADSSDADE